MPQKSQKRRTVQARFHVNDHVKYRPTHNIHGPVSTGTITEVRVSGGKATVEDPRYLIKNDHTAREHTYSDRSVLEKVVP